MTGTLLAAEAAKAGFTDINLGTVIWAWVSFGFTFFILSKVAWPMLARKMEERELRIAEGLKKAEEAEARARELAAKQEQIFEEARIQAQKFLAESRAMAENLKNELVSAAQQEIAEMRERAKKESALEQARAAEDLKRAAVQLPLEASSRPPHREMRVQDAPPPAPTGRERDSLRQREDDTMP